MNNITQDLKQRHIKDPINDQNRELVPKYFDLKKPILQDKFWDKNRFDRGPVLKFGTSMLAEKLRLVKTDNIYLDLSKVRLEGNGTLESKYEILQKLGSGAYGEVQKIRDLQTDEVKAVKFISKLKCHTVDKYNDEIEILKKLVNLIQSQDHPNVLRLYEFYQDDNYYCMITE